MNQMSLVQKMMVFCIVGILVGFVSYIFGREDEPGKDEKSDDIKVVMSLSGPVVVEVPIPEEYQDMTQAVVLRRFEHLKDEEVNKKGVGKTADGKNSESKPVSEHTALLIHSGIKVKLKKLTILVWARPTNKSKLVIDFASEHISERDGGGGGRGSNDPNRLDTGVRTHKEPYTDLPNSESTRWQNGELQLCRYTLDDKTKVVSFVVVLIPRKKK